MSQLRSKSPSTQTYWWVRPSLEHYFVQDRLPADPMQSKCLRTNVNARRIPPLCRRRKAKAGKPLGPTRTARGLSSCPKGSWIQLFTFIPHPVNYHNNVSERGPRRIANMRKISYGSRSKAYLKTTETLMSVYSTCKLSGVNFFEFVKAYLDGEIDDIPMPDAKAVTASAA